MHPRQQKISSLKVATLVIMLVGSFVVYDYLTQPVLAVDNLSATSSEEVSAGQELLVVVNKIKSIELDDSIFGDPLFTNLQDNTFEIVPKPVGRSNPFAPLGTQTTTEQPAPKAPTAR